MKLVVLGGTGGTGRAVLEQALAAGHDVTAVVRNRSALDARDRLSIVEGDVTDAGSLERHLEGADALISGLGSRASLREPVTLYSRSSEAIVEALRRRQVKRLLVVTAGGYVKDPAAHWWFRRVIQPILVRVLRHVYDDMQRMEAIIERSELDWTIVRPARLLDGPATGSYRTVTNGLVPKGGTITRADVAHLLLDALTHERFIRELVSVAY
jgi:putative NADH-flavin reductase